MEHTVAIKETHRPDSWVEMAAFLFHADAAWFARHLSNQDPFNRVVRVEGGKNYVNVYYRHGEELVAEGAE